MIKNKIKNLDLSATLKINEISKNLEKEGKKIIKFGFGQSPFPVPDSIVNELKKNANQKSYLPIQGLHDLREAIYLSDRILFLSKGPSKVIHDFNINVNRPREINDKELDTLRTNLISNHPDILSGKI